jgi:toxin-antitoxin system PIN domain toxin
VILVDANLLIYAYAPRTPEHEPARRWLEAQMNGTSRVGLPWASLLAFIRVMSNPRLITGPQLIDTAWRQVELWLDEPVAWVPQPTENHRRVLGDLVRTMTLTTKLVPDAHLAALAIEHGLTLCSTDGDFARFPGLRWENPIAPRR